MNLALQFPSTWDVKHTADGRVAAILPGPTGAALPDLIVTYGPLIVKPDEPRVWADQTARADIPRGASVKLGRMVDQTSNDGWPIRFIEADVTAETKLVEARLCVMYTFMEHACAVTVRAAARDRIEARFDELLAILRAGRPDWRAHPLCLADAWDLERPKPVQRAAPVNRAAMPDFFEQELARLEAIAQPTANDHLLRGVTLLSLSRPEDALAAANAALAIAPSERAHYLAGTALGALGRHRDAIAAWEKALALGVRVDTHYNLGQAHYTLGELAAALAAFEAARALDPSDLMIERKVIQCLYALGRYDEGAEARVRLKRAWSTTRDPRLRAQVDYVFDQFEGGGIRVHVVDTLVQRVPSITTLVTFRAVNEEDQRLGTDVLVETSEQARSAGTPYVVGVSSRGQFKVVATLDKLPPYPELREHALGLLVQVLRPTPAS